MAKAKAVAGDPNVLAHPGFHILPEPIFELEHEDSKAEYETLGRQLFNAGRLTIESHRCLSSYVMQFDIIKTAKSKGLLLKGINFREMEKARKALKLDEIDHAIAAAEDAPVSPFAHNGFACRSG